jgi:hypothetical protein
MLERLLNRRANETERFDRDGISITMTVGYTPDGTPGEVFLDGCKTGNDIESIARDTGVLLSLALQHGVPPETISHAITRGASEEPASILGAVVNSITTKSFSGGV